LLRRFLDEGGGSGKDFKDLKDLKEIIIKAKGREGL
jgi:hypothetical protein